MGIAGHVTPTTVNMLRRASSVILLTTTGHLPTTVLQCLTVFL